MKGRPTAIVSLVLALLVSCAPSAPDRPSAILITLDTTRADVLGCYGDESADSVTPEIDKLASESVLYERAHTTVPITLPSHASMLTGLYPVRHSVRDNLVWPLPSAALTLAELASQNGVQTAAFVSAAVLDRSFGLAQGFEHYEQPNARSLDATGLGKNWKSREVVARALKWLRERDRKRPLFLWVHLFDPHSPYEPPPRFSEGIYARSLGYYGEVAFMDEQIGRLVDALDDEGELANATLMIVADHGEAFGEHGEISHGAYTYESTLRIPMLLRLADGARAGERSLEIVSVVDVFPTLAEAMQLPFVVDLDGLSLLGDRVPLERGVYFESYFGHLAYNWSPLAGWLDAEGKYVHGSHPRFSKWDGEERDVLAKHPDEVRSYIDAMEAMAARPRLEVERAQHPDVELLEEIQALGYTSVAGERDELLEPTALNSLPDPAERIDEYNRCLEAGTLVNQGRYGEAELIFREILADSPSHFFALDRLGFALVDQGRFKEAIEPLQRLADSGPSWVHARLNLGVAKLRTDDFLGAVEDFAAALEMDASVRGQVDAYTESLRSSGNRKLGERLHEALR